MTCLEILPVCLEQGRPGLLRPSDQPSWQVAWDGLAEPGLQVNRELAQRRLEALVVHSTSWRIQANGLVITFVAALAPGPPPAGFDLAPVSPGTIAQGRATSAPERIEITQVVRHGLRHLAWLLVHDENVHQALPRVWQDALRGFDPVPFTTIPVSALPTNSLKQVPHVGAK